MPTMRGVCPRCTTPNNIHARCSYCNAWLPPERRGVSKKLTPARLAELEAQRKGPQPIYNPHRTRVQNVLVRAGFSKYVDVHGKTLASGEFAYRCAITPAGRRALKAARR